MQNEHARRARCIWILFPSRSSLRFISIFNLQTKKERNKMQMRSIQGGIEEKENNRNYKKRCIFYFDKKGLRIFFLGTPGFIWSPLEWRPRNGRNTLHTRGKLPSLAWISRVLPFFWKSHMAIAIRILKNEGTESWGEENLRRDRNENRSRESD